jgi:replication factor C subunit 1
MLWINKYKPNKGSDLVGVGVQYAALCAWYKTWKSKPLAVISGPVGVGKTAMLDVLVAELGLRNPLRVNSVGKKMKTVLDELAEAFDSRTVDAYFTGKMQKAKPNIIIIDEVDTITSTSAGSLAKLVTFVKKTKVPLLCTANDSNLKDIQSLIKAANHIRLQRPSSKDVCSRLSYILTSESIKMPISDLEKICTSCGHDMRQCITELEFAVKSATSSASVSSFVTRSTEMDKEMNPFDYLPHLFAPKPNLAMAERYKSEPLVPMLVEENYVRVRQVGQDMIAHMAKISRAADLISMGDVLQDKFGYGSLDDVAIISSYGPCLALSAGLASRPEFPSYLANKGAISENQAMITKLASHMGPSTNKMTVATEMYGYMHKFMVEPLVPIGQKPSVLDPAVFTKIGSIMNTMGLRSEDWDVMEKMGRLRSGPATGPRFAVPIPTKSVLFKTLKPVADTGVAVQIKRKGFKGTSDPVRTKKSKLGLDQETSEDDM